MLNKLSKFYNNKVVNNYKFDGVDELKDLFNANDLNKFNNIFNRIEKINVFIEQVYNKKIHIVYGLLLLERIDIEDYFDYDFHYGKLLELRDILFLIKN